MAGRRARDGVFWLDKNLPMLQLRFPDGLVSFDPQSLPDGSEFERVVSGLYADSVPVRGILELAFLYRRDYERARRVAGIAVRRTESTNAEDGLRVQARIYALALAVQHNVAREPDFYALDDVQDRRVDLLKGFYLYRKMHYEDALFLFSRVPYALGVDICRLGLGLPGAVGCLTDPRVLCYISSRYWSCFFATDFVGFYARPNFLFRINASEEQGEEEGLDTTLTLLARRIEETRALGSAADDAAWQACIKLVEDARERHPENAELCYLAGKVHHLRRCFTQAADDYRAALHRDADCFPAEYNLARIEQTEIAGGEEHASVHDYRALRGVMGGACDVSLDRCSDEVRRICLSIIKVGNDDADVRAVLQGLLDEADAGKKRQLFDKEILLNNLALLCTNKEERLQLLRTALEGGNGRFEDHLKYNIGIAAEDTALLRSSGLEEAALWIDLLEGNTAASDPLLRAFILVQKGDRDAARRILLEFLQSDSNTPAPARISDPMLAAFLLLGVVCLDEHLSGVVADPKPIDEAVKFYSKVPHSFIAVNGLAICLALKGRHRAALRLCAQIVNEYNATHYNMAAFHVLSCNYTAALECLLCLAEFDAAAEKLAVLLCRATGALRLVDRCIARGVLGLEAIKAALVQEATQSPSRDAVRARKIKEIEESRKKLHFG